jgi:hypothetical protein
MVGDVVVVDTDRFQEVGRFTPARTAANNASLAVNDRFVAASGILGSTVQIWTHDTRRPIGPPIDVDDSPGGFGAEVRAALIPGTDILVAANTTGAEEGSGITDGIARSDVSITDLVRSRPGEGGGARTLVRWALDPAEWVEAACAVAGRNLTRTEWERALPGTEQQATCPQWPVSP